MRYLAFIFAFYLMGMLLHPCSDTFNGCVNETKSKVLGHQHKKDTNDNCTPFCNCSCCQTVVDLKLNFFSVVEEKLVFEAKDFAPKQEVFVSNYHGNIWQPPKINA